jgi:hypothetical protein
MGYLLPRYVFDDLNNIFQYEIQIHKMVFMIETRSSKKNNNIIEVALFKQVVGRIMDMIYTLTKNRRSVVNIRYFHTQNEKKLPNPKCEKKLTSEHVNSGLCYTHSGENKVNIIIHRKEEFYKVLTHELLHLFDVIPYEKGVQDMYEKEYPMLPYINANEAYVELNALLLYTKILSDICKVPFMTLLAREHRWSNMQMNKLFKYFNISSLEDYGKWNETTSAFSYYIIKTFLLNNLLKDIELVKNVKYFNFDYVDRNSLRMTINDIEYSNLLKDLT